MSFFKFAGFPTNSDNDSDDDCFDEENLLRYYFQRGFTYKEILLFLQTYHNHTISYNTLLRRFRQYGLRRRGQINDLEVLDLRRRILEIMSGSGSLQGYRSVWHTLELEGLRVPRVIVADIIRELDPEGIELRKTHRLKRRIYRNPGPNYAWHVDGYDKLKMWGFHIHGCIDGYSRKILWLSVLRSNKLPDGPASLYLDTVANMGGCPVEVITDLGTENGLLAGMQSFFRDNADAHRYVTSQRNQRIECWWSFFSKHQSKWWRNFFRDLETKGILDTSSELSMECLWFCFSDLLQNELDTIKNHWNTHYIRRSRHDTVSGRPDSLYFLPHLHNAVNNMNSVPQRDIEYVSTHIIDKIETHELQEYFEYVLNSLNANPPTNWQEAVELYGILLHTATNGTQ